MRQTISLSVPRQPLRALLAAAVIAVGLQGGQTGDAQAGAVIFNHVDPNQATVALGVNNEGHLNFWDMENNQFGWDDGFSTSNAGAFGLAVKFPDGTWRDATAPGCLCEGWGVAVTLANGDRVSGFASVDNGGIGGLTGGSFGATSTTATSVVGLAGGPVVVTHAYGVSLVPGLFQGNVTITNTSDTETLSNVVYRRAMDWDIPPTEFNEYVSHYGVEANLVSNGGNVLHASDNGFNWVDPQNEPWPLNPDSANVDLVHFGPADHGSLFDFAFGDLAPGESRIFNIFYGVANNEAAAHAAMALLNPNVYSLGQATLGGGYEEGGDDIVTVGGDGEMFSAFSTASTGGSDAPEPMTDSFTFIFAFGGVGGVEPGINPESPVLPFVPAPGEFEFVAPTPRRWFDPPYAEGFEFALPAGEFLAVAAPPASFGYGVLELWVGGTKIADLDPGVEYNFQSDFNLSGVTNFIIRGIPDLSLDSADPDFSTLFPTFLDFTPGVGSLSMTALYHPTGGGGGGTVPEPATLALLLLALGMLGWNHRRLSGRL